MRFGDFVGNAAVKKQLAADIDAGRFPHALLIEGEVGSGRRLLARQIARAATCAGDGERPCGACAACRKTVHPDIMEIGGVGEPVTVDMVRALRQEAAVLPNEAAYRVMILCEAQLMTPQAQNALLKILEEPPRHVLFILTCENRTALLDTIRSRCVCVTLGAVDIAEALPVLRARLPKADEQELRRAHALFGGRIGRVLDGMADGTFRRVMTLTASVAAAVIAPQEVTLLRLTGALEKDKELTAGVLAGLRLVLRDALMVAHGSDALSTAPQEAALLAGRLSASRLTAMMAVTEELQTALGRNMNNTLLLTRLCACLRQAAGL